MQHDNISVHNMWANYRNNRKIWTQSTSLWCWFTLSKSLPPFYHLFPPTVCTHLSLHILVEVGELWKVNPWPKSCAEFTHSVWIWQTRIHPYSGWIVREFSHLSEMTWSWSRSGLHSLEFNQICSFWLISPRMHASQNKIWTVFTQWLVGYNK